VREERREVSRSAFAVRAVRGGDSRLVGPRGGTAFAEPGDPLAATSWWGAQREKEVKREGGNARKNKYLGRLDEPVGAENRKLDLFLSFFFLFSLLGSHP